MGIGGCVFVSAAGDFFANSTGGDDFVSRGGGEFLTDFAGGVFGPVVFDEEVLGTGAIAVELAEVGGGAATSREIDVANG